ncbi:uncharacterized protein [Callorhinus ursinus]|uniref:uncharacterized protein n=1 Tax=Callorhinus ursinus TaxID=34884 RepID=UPI003CD0061E
MKESGGVQRGPPVSTRQKQESGRLSAASRLHPSPGLPARALLVTGRGAGTPGGTEAWRPGSGGQDPGRDRDSGGCPSDALTRAVIGEVRGGGARETLSRALGLPAGGSRGAGLPARERAWSPPPTPASGQAAGRVPVPSVSGDLSASPARRAVPLPRAALSPSLPPWALSGVSLLKPQSALHTEASDLAVCPPCDARVPSEGMGRPSPAPLSPRPLHSSHAGLLLLPTSLLPAPGPLHLPVPRGLELRQIPARLSPPWGIAQHHLPSEGTTCLTLHLTFLMSPCPPPCVFCTGLVTVQHGICCLKAPGRWRVCLVQAPAGAR